MLKHPIQILSLHILLALVLAALIVILPAGPILMFLPWLLVVVVARRREMAFGRGFLTVVIYLITAITVIVVAILAPFKTTERMLDRQLELPKKEIILGEMDRAKNFEMTHRWLPRYVYIYSTPDNERQMIRFEKSNLTLREFVATIEAQSELRHRFAHCGNGYTILYGGDCSFGLHLH